MMNKILELYFDDKKIEKLIIYANANVTNLGLCGEIRLIYENDKLSYLLAWNDVEFIRKIYFDVMHVYNGEIILSEEFQYSMGYYANLLGAYHILHQQHSDLKLAKTNQGYHVWEGFPYIFSSSNDIAPIFVDSWLYNDRNGNIIFEITPNYPEFNLELVDKANYKKFLKWLQTYNPYVVKNISKNVLKNWLDTLEALVFMIDKNDEKLRAKGIICQNCRNEYR